ncbi:hypothetical protein [Falsigemmobacter faecalis]|uniref:hypothetical protein n=1 Tax=Falsigemmobacter faecalis TaxID=2488730 RepID=UPI0013156E86|nr:hypothetical protein [Falsigemmobacter faecalis]
MELVIEAGGPRFGPGALQENLRPDPLQGAEGAGVAGFFTFGSLAVLSGQGGRSE